MKRVHENQRGGCGEERTENRRRKEKKRVMGNNVIHSVYVSVRGRMAHNSRQDKFIRYFRLDCAALGQKLRLELANRKPGSPVTRTAPPKNFTGNARLIVERGNNNYSTSLCIFFLLPFFFLRFLENVWLMEIYAMIHCGAWKRC